MLMISHCFENRIDSSSSFIQDDLNNLKKWSDENGLKLNPSKCQALQVCFNKTIICPELKIGNETLKFVTAAKVLGLWLQNDLK